MASVLRGDCHHDALRKLLADNTVPFINVGTYQPDRPYPCVGTDNEGAAHRAASHVIELGHRKIGIASARQRNNDRASAARRGLPAGVCRERHRAGLRPEWHVEVAYTLDHARGRAPSVEPDGSADRRGLRQRRHRLWGAAGSRTQRIFGAGGPGSAWSVSKTSTGAGTFGRVSRRSRCRPRRPGGGPAERSGPPSRGRADHHASRSRLCADRPGIDRAGRNSLDEPGLVRPSRSPPDFRPQRSAAPVHWPPPAARRGFRYP